MDLSKSAYTKRVRRKRWRQCKRVQQKRERVFVGTYVYSVLYTSHQATRCQYVHASIIYYFSLKAWKQLILERITRTKFCLQWCMCGVHRVHLTLNCNVTLGHCVQWSKFSRNSAWGGPWALLILTIVLSPNSKQVTVHAFPSHWLF